DEITIIGSRCGRFEPAIEAMATGQVEVIDLISRRFDLSRGVEALTAAADAANIKVLIDVQHGAAAQ
ncbi:MAG: alcohol dehydrogenase, partial [Phycisphaerales bacterium]|nr:alcohol dehydrogenase [Phycisphaerales bacterium]